MRHFIVVAALATAFTRLAAQDTTSTAPLNVYLDCNEWQGCDFDFFRTELAYLSWVRDRQVADVHLLVTTQSTGAGGLEYTVTFLGLQRFTGLADTLKYVSPPESSRDDKRRGLARIFRAGLVRYLARTGMAERLKIEVEDVKKEAAADPTRDRWNFWVFSTRLSGWANGEKTYNSFSIFGRVSADRITERWKTKLEASNSYNQSEFEISATETFVNIQRGYGASVLQVKALGQYWSAGLRSSISSSSYENLRRLIRALPALEYNVFPYRESTRRQLRLEYNIGYADFAYRDTTIFDKMKERMPIQRLLVNVATREPWGSIDVGMAGTNYLNDPSKYRVGTFAELELRLFRGFSINGFGQYDIIRDQFALAKKDFTPEEILTRQFQRGTGYRFWGNVGISYTFGSIYNTVVNPRMSGSFFD